MICRTLTIALVATLLHFASPAPAAEPRDDQGTFDVLYAGKKIGEEKFTLRSNAGKIEAASEVRLHFDQPATVDLQSNAKIELNSRLEPVVYSCDQKGTETFHLEVDFRASPAKSHLAVPGSADDDRLIDIPRDVVILDNNIVLHYQLLAERFERAGGHKETFKAYIPQEATPGVVTVSDAGNEEVETAGRKEQLRHVVVETDLAKVDLWIDGDNRLIRMAILASKLIAVREGAGMGE